MFFFHYSITWYDVLFFKVPPCSVVIICCLHILFFLVPTCSVIDFQRKIHLEIFWVYNRVRFLISQLKNMFWRYSETTIEWGFWFVSEQNYFKHILSLWPSEVSNLSVKKVSRKYSECTTEWRFWLVSKKNNLKRFWVYSRYFCWSESETERGISWISFVRKKNTNWSRKWHD